MDDQNIGLVEATLQSMGAVGRDNAVTRAQVARALGLPHKDGARAVSKMLELERRTRVICSCGSGLFIPDEGVKGRAEIHAYMHKVEGIAKGSFRSIRGARLHQKNVPGQTELDVDEKGEG